MLKSFSSLKKENIEELAIGSFDGMHLAHQRLIEQLNENGAVLFIEHHRGNLTPNEYRCSVIDKACFSYDLGDIKGLSGDDFIDKLKSDFINLKKIVVGYDFGFGKNRYHSVDDLKRMFNGSVEVVSEVKIDNISIHSSTIREILSNGDIKLANRLLNRNYKIIGIRVNGQGIGKRELVPTINLKVEKFLIPKSGIYATQTLINKTLYNSVTFMGHRVTTDNSFAVETHLIDENIEFNEGEVEIIFLDFIRENLKFNSLKELREEIKKDILKAKEIFKTSLNESSPL